MTPLMLLRQLQNSGVHLEPDGERLRWKAPKGVLTDEMRTAIQQQKPQLLALLSSERLPSAAQQIRTISDSALRIFSEAVARNQWPGIPGLVRLNNELMKLWKDAEVEVGYPLTINGQPRIPKR